MQSPSHCLTRDLPLSLRRVFVNIAYVNLFFRSNTFILSTDPGVQFMIFFALFLLYYSLHCLSSLNFGKLLASLLIPHIESLIGSCGVIVFIGIVEVGCDN